MLDLSMIGFRNIEEGVELIGQIKKKNMEAFSVIATAMMSRQAVLQSFANKIIAELGAQCIPLLHYLFFVLWSEGLVILEKKSEHIAVCLYKKEVNRLPRLFAAVKKNRKKAINVYIRGVRLGSVKVLAHALAYGWESVGVKLDQRQADYFFLHTMALLYTVQECVVSEDEEEQGDEADFLDLLEPDMVL
ncbi:hypothetical protein [Persicobacter sp. CCB-QB2]|uniref:hypothetical protein n=1 Tax=Persicobacter sp. CCB-QB2 TaxID=1561025 RepID=UPI0006A9B21C|nr:hypothetical protein [Persicobacter sp. CCB-QB2]